MLGIGRREFITLLGGAAATWPFAARAQQAAMPVIGFLGPTSPEVFADRIRGFHRGLKETGYVEGENLTIAYRWAEGQFDRLPALAVELVRRQVAVIAAGANSAALAAKAATTTIPVLFIIPEDPVALGLVSSLARPGGNMTGVNLLSTEVAAKRLELLRELVPGAVRIAVLINPADANAEYTLRDVETAASTIGTANPRRPRPHDRRDRCGLRGFRARAAGRTFHQRRPLLYQPAHPIGQLGLASCDSHDLCHTRDYRRRRADELRSQHSDAWRQIGAYTGRILKGAHPADLPVVQVTKLELVINAQTARMLGLTVPPTLLSVADEVIE